MKIHSINSGFFKLDGGAMYGVVPKVMWNKLNPADEKNLCTWAMRLMLIEDGDKLILIDTGLGDKQDAKFFSHYAPSESHLLKENLNKAGFDFNDITDVILTHLHFDHCGGAVKWNNFRDGFEPVFPKAKYWTHKQHLSHALNSNPREKASFLKDNIEPLMKFGSLNYVEDEEISEHISFEIFNGHTEKMLVPIISYKQKTIAYCADLIPSASHLPVNFVMSYDIRPLETMKEKAVFLEKAYTNNYILFYEHDPQIAASTLQKDEKGRFISADLINIEDI